MKKSYLFSSGPISSDVGLLALRLFVGLTMLFAHGLPKLYSFSERAAEFPDPFGVGHQVSMGLAVFAEVLCSVGLIFGFMTRLATIPLFITMATAFIYIHGEDPWQKRELSFLYLAIYLGLFLLGPGGLSIDRFLGGKKSASTPSKKR